ncbi:MAG TPA: tetratricopeptide repeat protein [Verrucomicrobiae bacterium]
MAEDRTAGGTSKGSAPSSCLDRRRQWWFRLVALLLPVSLVILAEIVLRLAGFGYPTSFFLETVKDGRRELIENPRFGWRFFPARLARTPQPLSLAATKPAGSVRIFVFGESAAMGDPAPAFGFGRQLEVMLQARHPERTVEVINVAMTAINSHVMREIARDCAGLGGDCWIVYAGNNEVIGPYGAGTVFGRQAPPMMAVRLALTLKRTCLGQWIGGLRRQPNLPERWEGMELFLNQHVSLGDPRLERVYQNFSANLEAVIDRGRSSGAKVIVATVPVNLKDSPPFGSKHRAGLNPERVRAWDTEFVAGCDAEQQGRTADALSAYQRAAQIDPDYAELVFRRATCELAQGDPAAAGKDFVRARDLDTLRFRADTELNRVIREVAKAKKLRAVDTGVELAAGTATGVPGEELFYDHVHLNFHGNYVVAHLLASEIEREVFGSAGKVASEILKEDEVAKRLAFTDYERRLVIEEIRARLQQPPFSAQRNFKDRDERWRQVLEGLAAGAKDCLPQYAEALASRTNDWTLHANYARALEAAGHGQAAALEWQQVVRLMPHEPDGWFQLGNLALNGRNFSEAQRLLREALRRNPRSTEALNGLGLAASGLGQNSEAKDYLKAALKVDPRFSSARINLAVLLGNAGEAAAAAAEYRTVLAGESNNVAARINLARLLSAEGKSAEAISLLKRAVELKPDQPVAQYDLGNALSAQQQYGEAILHYLAAVKARPEFVEARYNLALEMARAGRMKEALVHFAEVVRLRPEFADAHFNYGVALARQKRYGEAVREFRETLRINPQHAAAGGALQRALMLEDQSKTRSENGN